MTAVCAEAKAKSKASAKADPNSSASGFPAPADPFAAEGFSHPYGLQALGASTGIASGSNVPFGVSLDSTLPVGATVSANGFDYSQIDFTNIDPNIDPALLPSEPMDVLAAHGGGGQLSSGAFVPFDYSVPVPMAAYFLRLPSRSVDA